jgi:hypothetical protein
MSDLSTFYIDPENSRASDLATGAESVELIRTDGQQETLLPNSQVLVTEESTPLSQMEEDLGAICEVYRQSSNYFLSIPGVRLEPGDRVIIRYPGRGKAIVLHVIELENGRARIEPPSTDQGKQE